MEFEAESQVVLWRKGTSGKYCLLERDISELEKGKRVGGNGKLGDGWDLPVD